MEFPRVSAEKACGTKKARLGIAFSCASAEKALQEEHATCEDQTVKTGSAAQYHLMAPNTAQSLPRPCAALADPAS